MAVTVVTSKTKAGTNLGGGTFTGSLSQNVAKGNITASSVSKRAIQTGVYSENDLVQGTFGQYPIIQPNMSLSSGGVAVGEGKTITEIKEVSQPSPEVTKQIISKTKGSDIAKFYATGGKEGLPFEFDKTYNQPIYNAKGEKVGYKTGTIGYNGREYTSYTIEPSKNDLKNQTQSFRESISSNSKVIRGANSLLYPQSQPSKLSPSELIQSPFSGGLNFTPASPYGYTKLNGDTIIYNYETEKQMALQNPKLSFRQRVENYFQDTYSKTKDNSRLLYKQGDRLGYALTYTIAIPATAFASSATSVVLHPIKSTVGAFDFLTLNIRKDLINKEPVFTNFVREGEYLFRNTLENPTGAIGELGGTAFGFKVLGKGASAVKTTYKLGTRTFVPEPIGKVSKRQIFVENSINAQTSALDLSTLPSGSNSKVIINYMQKFKAPFGIGNKRVPVTTTIQGGTSITQFSFKGIDYTLTKLEGLKKTNIYKEYPTTPLSPVSFAKKINFGGVNIGLTNIKSTPIKTYTINPSSSELIILKEYETLFDIKGKAGRTKVQGFGKTQTYGVSYGVAEPSLVSKYKTRIEGSRLLEKGTLSKKDILAESDFIKKNTQVKETFLEYGKADYSKNLKTKLLDKSSSINEYGFESKIKGRIIKKGNVNTQIAIKQKSSIQFAGTKKGLKQIYKGTPYEISTKEPIQLSSTNQVPAFKLTLESLKQEAGIEFKFESPKDVKKFATYFEKGKKEGLNPIQVQTQSLKPIVQKINFDISPESQIPKTIQSNSAFLSSQKPKQTSKVLFVSGEKNQIKNDIVSKNSLKNFSQTKIKSNNKVMPINQLKSYNQTKLPVSNKLKNFVRNETKNELKNEINTKNLIKNELKQNQIQEVKQELRQQQKQILTQKLKSNLAPELKIPNQFTKTNFRLTDKIKQKVTKIFSSKSIYQPKKYTPTITAISLNLKGSYSKSGELSGLGLRPILIKKRKMIQ